MNIINLEIDSRIKKLLHDTLTDKDIVGISFQSKKHKITNSTNRAYTKLPPQDDKFKMSVRIYAETEAIGRIIKSIVQLGRDGLSEFPIKVLSVMQVAPC